MEEEQLHLCPHCGNKAIHRLINEIEVEEDSYDLDNEYQTFVYNYYYIFKCSTCNRSSIYAHFFIYPQKGIESLECLYPIIRNISKNLPHSVKRIYLDAKRVEKLSPTSSIILIRKVLELICVDQGATGKNLSEKITSLIKREILPKKIGDLALMIKKIGNISAHRDESINLWDVESVNEFLEIIVEYIYSIDSKIESLKRKWNFNERDI